VATSSREGTRIAIKVPDVELEHLPKAPLKFAIAQVRFAPVFAIERREQVAAFQELLGDRYIALESTPPKPRIAAVGAATPQPAGADPETVWQFRRPEHRWTISLSSTSLALEAVKYRDFDDFAAELSTIVKALHEVFEPKHEVRLGLRYVNHIEDERLQKRGVLFFLNEQLAAPIGADLGNDLIGSLAELRFRERGGTLAIRHGLIEPTRYLLDFDRFNAEERDFAPDSVVKRVKRFHDLIERLFVWSISERYLKELRRAAR
jgi:uncharacterized protein (TIGR04255 family)